MVARATRLALLDVVPQIGSSWCESRGLFPISLTISEHDSGSYLGGPGSRFESYRDAEEFASPNGREPGVRDERMSGSSDVQTGKTLVDWLFQNPLADLSGPQFLVLYLIAAVATHVGVRFAVLRALPADPAADESLPLQPDPYEIAYLHGGEEHVLRTAVAALVERGDLKLASEKPGGKNVVLMPANRVVDADIRHPVERSVLATLRASASARELFDGAVRAGIHSQCKTYERDLTHRGLLCVAPPDFPRILAGLAGAGFLFTLTAYRLLEASHYGRKNIGLLILFWLISTALLPVTVRVSRRRLTQAGQRFLSSARTAFTPMREQLLSTDRSAAWGGLLPLVVATFGVGVLSQTSFAAYPSFFQRAATKADGGSAGCGAAVGCGSSCGGGGGCGGGGCGGGGCGG